MLYHQSSLGSGIMDYRLNWALLTCQIYSGIRLVQIIIWSYMAHLEYQLEDDLAQECRVPQQLFLRRYC